jgi:hypothetical protein
MYFGSNVKMRRENVPGAIAVALIATAVLATSCADFVLAAWLRHFAIGDAVAYWRVGFNIATTGRVTYDLIHPTNGFHPLWLALHVPLFIGASDIASRMPLVLTLVLATAGLAVFHWGRLLAQALSGGNSTGRALLLTCGYPWVILFSASGLETGLTLLLLAVFLRRLLYGPDAPFALGLVGGLCFLARLDSVFLLGFALLVARPAWLGSWRAIVVALLGFLLLTIPYLLSNAWFFGSLIPVSGIAKTEIDTGVGTVLAKWAFWYESHRVYGRVWTIVGASAPILAPVACLVCSRALTGRARLLLLIVGGGALLHYFYYTVRIIEINVGWHVYPSAIAGLAVIVALPRFIVNPRWSLGVGWMIICACFSISAAALTVRARTRGQAEQEIAHGLVLDRVLPTGASLCVFDSWWYGYAMPLRPVIDLSALVGSREMADARRRKEDLLPISKCAFYGDRTGARRGIALVPRDP